MRWFNIFLLIVLCTLVACSRGPVDSEELDDIPGSEIEVADGNDDLLIEDEEFDQEQAEVIEEVEGQNEVASAPVEVSAEIGQYQVQAGDTMMLIAFKIYGDYAKWRSINNLNPGIVNKLKIGQKISYEVPKVRFEWNPQGSPHLITSGETLGIISQKYYDTTKKWRNIWENNRLMIKNPNLIFAGFTLYYITDTNIAAN